VLRGTGCACAGPHASETGVRDDAGGPVDVCGHEPIKELARVASLHEYDRGPGLVSKRNGCPGMVRFEHPNLGPARNTIGHAKSGQVMSSQGTWTWNLDMKDMSISATASRHAACSCSHSPNHSGWRPQRSSPSVGVWPAPANLRHVASRDKSSQVDWRKLEGCARVPISALPSRFKSSQIKSSRTNQRPHTPIQVKSNQVKSYQSAPSHPARRLDGAVRVVAFVYLTEALDDTQSL
jgi:hypothetical protein